jgi:hypothetical protein
MTLAHLSSSSGATNEFLLCALHLPSQFFCYLNDVRIDTRSNTTFITESAKGPVS